MENKSKLWKVTITILMLILGIAFLLPFIWMLSASFKPEVDVFKYPIEWIPKNWQAVQNYTEVWFGEHPFGLYYWNSIKISVLTTIISVTVSCMAAYAFAKLEFIGKNVLFILVLMTFMIPSSSIIVPQFIIFRWLHLFDSHLGLILVGSFSALGTFMLRQFFMGLHNEFLDAARMDGAGQRILFTKVAVPLVRPAIATYAILRFIWTWNDYQNPLIFLRSDHLSTIQIGIQKFSSESGAYYSLIMAGTVSAIIPLLLIFILGQKQVMEGIAMGGVKG
ncbi:sugar ABC transporter ATP-binding protein [Paenibacillus selenitireducens]|uniref:Sugar ABC transporter ATP-binding protein n=1 Tax=Paenibacillus selenitireducens TaxID=1324314 RepID=A0A1T2XM80_9BACL|nr:carbohydrate ABC transporter permease [Paenibacillus selenitireducens]OPA80974.1 sugar ABC transporter ATP-binding protein [Paenibacillus selenitireducens]